MDVANKGNSTALFFYLFRVSVHSRPYCNYFEQAFIGNQSTCLKVQPRQLEKIIALVGEHQERVPEFLALLASIVKVQGLDIPLKRNQAYVMKFIMQSYSKIAFLFDQTKENR